MMVGGNKAGVLMQTEIVAALVTCAHSGYAPDYTVHSTSQRPTAIDALYDARQNDATQRWQGFALLAEPSAAPKYRRRRAHPQSRHLSLRQRLEASLSRRGLDSPRK